MADEVVPHSHLIQYHVHAAIVSRIVSILIQKHRFGSVIYQNCFAKLLLLLIFRLIKFLIGDLIAALRLFVPFILTCKLHFKFHQVFPFVTNAAAAVFALQVVLWALFGLSCRVFEVVEHSGRFTTQFCDQEQDET